MDTTRIPTPSDTATGPYAELLAALREAAVLASAGATLGWDQEVMMPPRAAPLRSEQLSVLAGLVHDRRTAPRIGELLAACEGDAALLADDEAAANLRAIRHDYERATRLPGDLVRAWAETTALSMHAWRDARERDDFTAFAPWLERIVGLSRERADCLCEDGGDRYDALLEEFEPGMRAATLDSVFAELRAGLAPMIASIASSGRGPDTSLLRTPVAVERQVAFGRSLLERMGFDFDGGRLDVSTHPFCESAGPGDTRLTTRYAEDAFTEALTSSMHEAGHGLYEQGLPREARFGQPLAEACSLGIHESQSRMWENMVGRSRPFWEWALPAMQASTGDAALSRLDVEAVYRAMNTVEPTLIRIESDEATYNLHIMLRFDLERALLAGDLSVADLPGAWNERIRADLGLEVPDDRRGVLQDIHWSMGAIGYFPTYTLGNLYAAQLWETIGEAVPDLDERMRRGDFTVLLGWLREHVHRHGRRFPAPELCERITGRPLSHEPLLSYLRAKLAPIYGL